MNMLQVQLTTLVDLVAPLTKKPIFPRLAHIFAPHNFIQFICSEPRHMLQNGWPAMMTHLVELDLANNYLDSIPDMKVELDDALQKMKRHFREELDESLRAIDERRRLLFATNGKSNSFVFRLEHLMEVAFSPPHDKSGLSKMTLGFGEAHPPVAGHSDNRKKIINHIYPESRTSVYVRSISEELIHIVFLNEDTMLLWQHVLSSQIEQNGLVKLDTECLTVEKF